MLDPADAHEAFFEPPVDEPPVFARPAEELLALALELRGEGGAFVGSDWLAAFTNAWRACSCASSEETFGCKERMRRWFFA